jgi:hypothetical protein
MRRLAVARRTTHREEAANAPCRIAQHTVAKRTTHREEAAAHTPAVIAANSSGVQTYGGIV